MTIQRCTLAGFTSLIMFLFAYPVCGQDIEYLKKGVVKITAKVDGKTKVGTGFIVRLEKDAAYIVTASHVIEGDSQPQVDFFPKPTRSFPARVLGLDGGNPRGLAALLVEGDLPPGLQALRLDPNFEVAGGESITVIGFPRTAGVPWAITPGSMSGLAGQNFSFSGAAVREGNSGGPIIVGGSVIGVVTDVMGEFGYAVPVSIVRLALSGWSVPLLPAGLKGQFVPLNAPSVHTRGKVKLTVFSDFYCEPCYLFEEATLPVLEKEFGNRIDVTMVGFQSVPGRLPTAFDMYEQAKMMGKGKEMKRVLFRAIHREKILMFDRIIRDSICTEIGLDPIAFHAGLESGKPALAFRSGMTMGERMNVQQTPAVILDGNITAESIDAENLKTIILSILAAEGQR